MVKWWTFVLWAVCFSSDWCETSFKACVQGQQRETAKDRKEREKKKAEAMDHEKKWNIETSSLKASLGWYSSIQRWETVGKQLRHLHRRRQIFFSLMSHLNSFWCGICSLSLPPAGHCRGQTLTWVSIVHVLTRSCASSPRGPQWERGTDGNLWSRVQMNKTINKTRAGTTQNSSCVDTLCPA